MGVITTTTSTTATGSFSSASGPIFKQAQSFTATETGTVGLVVCLAYNDNGTPTFDARISVYSDVTGSPGVELFVGHVAFAGIPATNPIDLTVTWDTLPPTVVNGITYWIVYTTDGTNFSGTHYFLPGGESNAVYGVEQQNDGISWTTQTRTLRAVITTTAAGGTATFMPKLLTLKVG